MTMMFNTMFNETRKGLIIMWDYKFSTLIGMGGVVLAFIGIMFFVGQGKISDGQATSSILGFIVTYYAIQAIENMSWSLMTEANAGTLEQMYMSPSPSQIIVLGRLIASLIATTFLIVILVVALLIVFGISIPFDLEGIPVLIITMIGLMGFGFIMGGLTLVFKQVGPLSNMVSNLILIANGTFLPVYLMPYWIAALVSLLPSTVGIIIMRRVVLEGQSLAEAWADGSLPLLIGHSITFFVLGWFIYAYCERVARRQGTLGQY